MSNLFFKSESVKNSVKSGLNFVSNRVFKAFLLMGMMLLSWNGWGQGYTVIYPEGQTMANPGDVVTVVFDEDVSKYYYGVKHQNYCFEVEEKTTKTIDLGFIKFDVYEAGEVKEPVDCASDYLQISYITNLEQGEDRFTIKITIPQDHHTSFYDIFYGTKTNETIKARGYTGIFNFDWDEKTKKWTKSFTPKGSVRIDVVSENLTLRSSNTCYCPSETLIFSLENNVYGDNLIWHYDSGTQSGEFTPTKVSENVYQYVVPETFLEGVTISCRGNVTEAEETELSFEICSPIITPQQECVDINNNALVTIIENACPVLSYTVVDKKLGATVWPTSGQVNSGSTSYQAKFNVGEFEKIFDKDGNHIGYYPKYFDVYANGKLLTSFPVKECDNTISCKDYTPGDIIGCSVAFDEISSNVQFTKNGGMVTATPITFFKENGGDWQTVTNSSRLEPCHTYQIRTNIYIDNINVGYCDSKTFEVQENEVPKVPNDYDKDATVQDCKFTIPDLVEEVRVASQDNCTAQEDLLVTQTPAAGEEITQTSDVIVEVRDKCNKTSSVTIKVIVPDVLSFGEFSQQETMTCSDGKPHATISSSVSGGVAPYTITVTKDDTPLSEKSQELQTVGNFSIADLEVGKYKVTVTDVNGCEVTKEVSVTFTPQELTITGKNIEKIYNGQPQSAEVLSDTLYSVEGLIDGDEITSITFTQENPLTDVGEISYSIKGVEISREGVNVTCFYDIAATGAKFKVVPRQVTLTSADDEKVYDGTALTNDEVTVGGDGFVAGEATATAIGSQTEVGSSKNTIEVEEGINFKLSNYDITPVKGDLKVTPDIVTVQIKGNKQTFTYNGSEQQVSGYEVISITSSSLGDATQFTKDMVTFVPTEDCDGTVVRTDVGKTFMNLTSENFKSTNGNFVVTFNVTDGYVDITAIEEVVVTIVGNHLSTTYDGEEHTVIGYEVTSISSDLYDASNIIYDGNNGSVSRTDYGKSEMGLSAGNFRSE
ncbi:MAG: hypothetical protein U0L67_08935, partial [Paludibacteraceae bacterium]|nr:hypothetical protein [Paludibacteraceae bacterium]